MVPRSTLAQKMDALSVNILWLAIMVLLGAERIAKILPMMTTPMAPFNQPVSLCRGRVAGLQAIATAKRLVPASTPLTPGPRLKNRLRVSVTAL